MTSRGVLIIDGEAAKTGELSKRAFYDSALDHGHAPLTTAAYSPVRAARRDELGDGQSGPDNRCRSAPRADATPTRAGVAEGDGDVVAVGCVHERLPDAPTHVDQDLTLAPVGPLAGCHHQNYCHL